MGEFITLLIFMIGCLLGMMIMAFAQISKFDYTIHGIPKSAKGKWIVAREHHGEYYYFATYESEAEAKRMAIVFRNGIVRKVED